MVSNSRNCFVCGTTRNLHRHHIFFGANRKVSEKYDLCVWLCQNHHEGTMGVHGMYGHELDMELKRIGQITFEKTHTREEFIAEFGRNYL